MRVSAHVRMPNEESPSKSVDKARIDGPSVFFSRLTAHRSKVSAMSCLGPLTLCFVLRLSAQWETTFSSHEVTRKTTKA